jgi:hypothetical protein
MCSRRELIRKYWDLLAVAPPFRRAQVEEEVEYRLLDDDELERAAQVHLRRRPGQT